MRSFFAFGLAAALAGQAAGLNVTFDSKNNITVSDALNIPDGSLKAACQASCDPAVAAVKACGDFNDGCLCSNETTTKFLECEQCWFRELISKNEKMPDPRAGSKPLLDSYSNNCAKLSLPTQPLALQLPPDWDGPRNIELNLPATVVTVGFGGLMGATFLYLLSNI